MIRLVKFFSMFIFAVLGGIVFIPLLGGGGAAELKELFTFSDGFQLVRRNVPPEEVYYPLKTELDRRASLTYEEPIEIDSSSELEDRILDLQIETNNKDREITTLRSRIEVLEELDPTEKMPLGSSYEQTDAVRVKRILEKAQDKLLTRLIEANQENKNLEHTIKIISNREESLLQEIATLKSQIKSSPSAEEVQLLKEANAELQSRNGDTAREMEAIRASLEQAGTEADTGSAKIRDLQLQVARLNDQIASKGSEVALAQTELKASADEAAQLRSQLESQLARAGESLNACQADLERNLKVAKESGPLRREVAELNAKLAMLQADMTKGGRKVVAKKTPVVAPKVATTQQRTVKVSVPKAVLRLGPGREHGKAMEVGKGTMLMVEAAVGEWLRVIGPTGQRVFILDDLVSDTAAVGIATPPTRQRVTRKPPMKPLFNGSKNAEGSADENQAFELLRQHLRAR